MREIYDMPSTRNFRLLLQMIAKASIARLELEAGIAEEAAAAARPLREAARPWTVGARPGGGADLLARAGAGRDTGPRRQSEPRAAPPLN